MNHFVDYYEDLQVSPNADKETIDSVYRHLARRWHPDNPSGGDPEKFNTISEAHKVLSDPQLRAEYDAGYETNKSCQWEVFSEFPSPDKAMTDANIRNTILSILYVSRRQDPENGGEGLWRLSKLVGWPENEITFHIWYLKEKGYIQRNDSGGYAITANGVDIVETQKSETGEGEQRLLPADGSPEGKSQGNRM